MLFLALYRVFKRMKPRSFGTPAEMFLCLLRPGIEPETSCTTAARSSYSAIEGISIISVQNE